MKKINKNTIEYVETVLNSIHFEIDKAKQTGTFSPNYMLEKTAKIMKAFELEGKQLDKYWK